MRLWRNESATLWSTLGRGELMYAERTGTTVQAAGELGTAHGVYS